jgi:hypothetical protein
LLSALLQQSTFGRLENCRRQASGSANACHNASHKRSFAQPTHLRELARERRYGGGRERYNISKGQRRLCSR